MEAYRVHAQPERQNGAAPPPRPRPAQPPFRLEPNPIAKPAPVGPSSQSPSFPPPGSTAHPAGSPLNGAGSSMRRVLYPPHVIPNRTYIPGRTKEDATLGLLEQPEFLPAELDARVDPSTVWMKVAPSTGEAVFFIPGACASCLKAAQHCDRSFPCARCRDRGTECNQAELRHLMPTAPVVRKPEMVARTLSGSTDKGKGKAKAPPPSSDSEEDESDTAAPREDGGRGKRIKKKRRLSASDEVDPNLLNFDGSGFRKPRAARQPKAGLPGATMEPTRPEDVTPSKADVEHFESVAKNNERPDLHDMRGFAPVWADRRRALAAAVEAFRAPQTTPGASVSVGPSGIARGVILEGKPPLEMRTYWGTGERIGTIITSIGAPRKRQLQPEAPADADKNDVTALPDNISDAYNDAMTRTADQGHHLTNGTNGPAQQDRPALLSAPIQNTEAPIIEALLMAQRAQTPVAVAVANDFTEVPFKVPRPVVTLGWFWIVEAWVEPVESPDTVGWVFRFEWCTGEQPQPWWAGKDDPERTVETPVFDEETTNATPAWPVKGRNVHGSTTLRGAESPRPRTTTADGEAVPDPEPVECDSCKRYSERVYRDMDICLNELCVNVGCPVTPPPPGLEVKNYPGVIRAAARILPEQLGLTFLPPEPTQRFADVTRWDAGRDFWRSWVCRRCRLANERQDWFGFLCQACSHIDMPPRRTYGAEALRTATSCTGPRPDIGDPSWPFAAETESTVFPDHIKLVQHKLTAFGPGTEASHLLNSDGAESYKVITAALRGLQLQGADEVPLARHMLPATSARPDLLALSPFYTIACGATAPQLAHFPAASPVPWARAPRVAVDIMELINERAGRVYGAPQRDGASKDAAEEEARQGGTGPDGAAPAADSQKRDAEQEFNALLLAALPPAPSVVVHPKIPLPPSSTLAVLVLGSSVNFKLRRTKMRAGELTAQHGDVLVVRTGAEALELEAKSDGFAFLCIARRGVQPPQPSGSGTGVPGGWYIGPRPLDATRPLRVEVPLRRESAVDEEADGAKQEDQEPESNGEKSERKRAESKRAESKEPRESDEPTDMEVMLERPTFRGQEVVSPAPEEPTISKPPASGPLPAKFKVTAKPKAQTTKKTKAPVKPKGRTTSTSTRAGKSAASTPPAKRSRRSRGGRASASRSASVAAPAEDGAKAEPE